MMLHAVHSGFTLLIIFLGFITGTLLLPNASSVLEIYKTIAYIDAEGDVFDNFFFSYVNDDNIDLIAGTYNITPTAALITLSVKGIIENSPDVIYLMNFTDDNGINYTAYLQGGAATFSDESGHTKPVNFSINGGELVFEVPHDYFAPTSNLSVIHGAIRLENLLPRYIDESPWFQYSIPTAIEDFLLSLNTTEITLRAGTKCEIAVTITPINGFKAQVYLGVKESVHGMTFTFLPNDYINTEGTVTLQIITSEDTLPGTYYLTIYANSGAINHTETITLHVVALERGNFSITIQPEQRTIIPGEIAEYYISITANGSFSEYVNLSAYISPLANIDLYFDMIELTPGQSTVLHINTTIGTRAGTYTITVVGRSNSLQRYAYAYLLIEALNTEFTLSVDKQDIEIDVGDHSTVSVSLEGDPSLAVVLGIDNMPFGMTYLMERTELDTAHRTSKITFFVSESTVPGNYTIVLYGDLLGYRQYSNITFHITKVIDIDINITISSYKYDYNNSKLRIFININNFGLDDAEASELYLYIGKEPNGTMIDSRYVGTLRHGENITACVVWNAINPGNHTFCVKLKYTGGEFFRIFTISIPIIEGNMNNNSGVDAWDKNNSDGNGGYDSAKTFNNGTINYVLWVVILSAAIISISLVLAYIYTHYGSIKAVEDVFVIYWDGRLIYHGTRRLQANVDSFVLSGMLTAIQDFVKNAMPQEKEAMSTVRVGETNFLISRGKHIILAVGFKGLEPLKIKKRIEKAIGSIENRYAPVLESWNGDMKAFDGIDKEINRAFVLDRAGW